MTGKLAAALLLLLPAVGCRRTESVEEHRVTTVVREYNQLLPRVYLTRKPALLTCATPNEIERLEMLVDGLEQRGLVLDSRQESLEIGAIRIDDPPQLADVETTETWWYRQERAGDRSHGEVAHRIRYGLRYKLVQHEGRWLVDRIELLKSEELPAGT